MTNKIRCVIVDDEKHAIALLSTYISNMPNLELIKTYNNPVHALSEINKKDRIDILFLDIEMPDISGMELAVSLKPKTKSIIFTSAYEKYALKAFDVRANHYLVKPIKQAKFSQSVMEVVEQDLPRLHKCLKNAVFFKTGEKGKLTKVKKQDIIYFEGAGNYVKMVTTKGDPLVYLTLVDVEKIFKDDLFFRIHRSHVINAKKIDKVTGNLIYFKSGHKLQMTEYYKKNLINYFEENTIETGRF
ncbi:response regulator [Pedobacter petrophilus]|uniref:Response regulator n=1 Tax=Pedobacter petrophilus TaxID=1908241 RepID=A0A7K0FVD2_9SPHI|nr:LytTR family DNA-binding domain-containing protein [Pedobacter petrophilus]MRX74706.1 response regulator [Pedobacter petrophilus]